MNHFFKGEPVFFIHRQQERREHDRQHKEHGPGIPQGLPRQQIGRDADGRRPAKADELAFCKVKGHLRFDFG